MLIWIITIGEPLPFDSESPRHLRSGLLAQELASRDHSVVWWADRFDYIEKKQRTVEDSSAPFGSHIELRLLKGCGYQRNISLKRFVHHFLLAKDFKRALRDSEEAPDVVLCSVPIVELAGPLFRHFEGTGTPIVLDLRDLWPDIFLEFSPSFLRPLARLVLQPYFASMKSCCSRADALLAISPEFLSWGLAYAGRKQRELDASFSLPAGSNSLTEAEREEALRFWEGHGVCADDSCIRGCFFGVLSSKIEVETLLALGPLLQDSDVPVQVVLCGTADDLPSLRKRFAPFSNIVLPGWVDSTQISTLLSLSNFGLAPYRSRKDFMMSVPTKVVEYLSAGLPVISSLQGATEKVLREGACGLTYTNGSAESLLQSIEHLVEDKAYAARLGENASVVYQSSFDSKQVLPAMATHLEGIAQKKEG